jgi:hypothetical protein
MEFQCQVWAISMTFTARVHSGSYNCGVSGLMAIVDGWLLTCEAALSKTLSAPWIRSGAARRPRPSCHSQVTEDCRLSELHMGPGSSNVHKGVGPECWAVVREWSWAFIICGVVQGLGPMFAVGCPKRGGNAGCQLRMFLW